MLKHSWRPATLLKRDSNTFFCAYSIRNCFFYRQLWWLLLQQVLVWEDNFWKKLMECLALISLFQVQIQEPASRSIITRAFVFLAKFIVAKYLEQNVIGDLSICVDEPSCYDLSVTGDKDLSKSHDQKVMMLLPIMENCPMDFYQGVVLLPKFDNSTPCD